MVHALSIDDAIQEVVGETLEQGGHAGEETPSGLSIFEELRREFPQASIMTINLAALLEALDEAVQREDA